MSAVYTIIWVALLIAWPFYKLVALAIPARRAASFAVLTGFAIAIFAGDFPPSTALVALFDPMAIIIPVLVVQSLRRTFGYAPIPTPKWELGLFLIVWLIFIALSIGVVQFDPYRLGYHALPVGMITAGFILYGAIRKNLTLPLIALFSQIMWGLGVNSSNYFDNLQHFLLLPILVVALLRRRKPHP